MKTFTPFVDPRTLNKSADEQIVYGIASTSIVDDQPGIWEGRRYDGDVVDPQGMREALQDYWGNIREMHGEGGGAAGTALDLFTSPEGVTYLVAKVVDHGAWEKVRTQVYKGFSIGGRVLKAKLERMADGRIVRRILKLLLTEISLVDRPANPEAAILVFKRLGGLVEENAKKEAGAGAIDALSSLVEKAADPTKVVTQIQTLRNEAELSGDLEGAERYTQAIGLLLIGSGTADAPEDEAAAEDEAVGDEEIAMAEDMPAEEEDEEEIAMGAVAMAAKAKMKKAGRKIAGSRMKIMKDAVMAYLKVLEEAGDEDSAAMLKAVASSKAQGGLMDAEAMKALFGELQKAVNTPIETIAKAVLKLNTDLETLKAQPLPGGPVGRFAGQQVQPIAKRLGQGGGAQVVEQADAGAIANLKRLIATEGHPGLVAQYTEQLKALTGK